MNILSSFSSIETKLYPIFILILIISSNFLAEVFPCRFQEMLSKNMYLKHIFGYLTMVFFVTMTLDEYNNTYSFTELFKSSLFMYFGFIVFSKTSTKFFFPVLFFLGLLYILHIRKSQLQTQLQQKNTTDDMISSNQKQLDTLNTIMDVSSKITLVILAMGFFVYIGEKRVEYKNNFNFLTFLFGKTNCKGKSPKVSILKALQNIL